MNPAIPPSPTNLSPADRLAFILERLHQALGRHADAQRMTGRLSIIGPFLMLIWQRLRRIGLRFAARAAREAAWRSAKVPAIRGIDGMARRSSRDRPKPRTPDPLPRHEAWLLRLIPETAPITRQLRCFMAEPEVAALLAASPRLCGILNPLCHMLGIQTAGIQAAGIQAAGIRPAQAPPSLAVLNPPLPDAPLIPGHAPPQAAPIAVLPRTTPSSSPVTPPSEFLTALA